MKILVVLLCFWQWLRHCCLCGNSLGIVVFAAMVSALLSLSYKQGFSCCGGFAVEMAISR